MLADGNITGKGVLCLAPVVCVTGKSEGPTRDHACGWAGSKVRDCMKWWEGHRRQILRMVAAPTGTDLRASLENTPVLAQMQRVWAMCHMVGISEDR